VTPAREQGCATPGAPRTPCVRHRSAFQAVAGTRNWSGDTPAANDRRADRPRAHFCFVLAEQSSEEAGPAQLAVVPSERPVCVGEHLAFRGSSGPYSSPGLLATRPGARFRGLKPRLASAAAAVVLVSCVPAPWRARCPPGPSVLRRRAVRRAAARLAVAPMAARRQGGDGLRQRLPPSRGPSQ